LFLIKAEAMAFIAAAFIIKPFAVNPGLGL